jgi:hypothetical protein
MSDYIKWMKREKSKRKEEIRKSKSDKEKVSYLSLFFFFFLDQNLLDFCTSVFYT